PHLRIFVDDRCELYGDEFLKDYFRVNEAFIDAKEEGKDLARMDDPFERWGKQYGIDINLALVIKNSGFQFYLDSARDRWVLIGDSSQQGLEHPAMLYERRSRFPGSPKQ